MAEDLIRALAEARPVFRPHSLYVKDADFLEIFLRDDEAIAERVDGFLTVYWSREDDEILVGCEIKSVKRFVDEAGGRYGINIARDGKIKLSALLITHRGIYGVPHRLEGRYYDKLIRFAETEPELELASGARGN